MKKINEWTMKNRRMYIDGELLDRKVRSFSYDATDDVDVLTVNCYVEVNDQFVIDETGRGVVMEALEFELGRDK